MYHGNTVPGFPAHPHRGFETVTIVRQGFIDHSDSLGATARFGPGDVQWLTAGKGIVHCEMFPLRNAQSPNPAELFQIWLNLPAQSKMVEPHFTMHWGEQIPAVKHVDAQGLATEVQVVAGALEGAQAAAPPPDSWARRPEADLAIFTIRMARAPPGRCRPVPAPIRCASFTILKGRACNWTANPFPGNRWPHCGGRTRSPCATVGTAPNCSCCKRGPLASPWRSTGPL